jgi:hypothetical protein
MAQGFDGESSYFRYLRQESAKRKPRVLRLPVPGKPKGHNLSEEEDRRRDHRVHTKEDRRLRDPAPPLASHGAKADLGGGLGLLSFRHVILFFFVVATGVVVYMSLRQSQVEVVWEAPELEPPPKVYLVGDFSGDLRAVQQEFRSAGEPFEEEVRMREEALHRVESDLAGLQERLELLRREKTNVEGELRKVISENEEKERRIWEGEGVALERRRKAKLAELERVIRSRAEGLHLALELRQDAPKDPEVWVNAFRLALYRAPAGVQVTQERQWAEGILEDWHKFQAAHQKEKEALAARLEQTRTGIRDRVSAALSRIRELERRIRETEEECKPVEREREADAISLEEARARRTSVHGSYAQSMLRIPERYVIGQLFRTGDGRYRWVGWDQDPRSAIRHWYLWVKTGKGRQEYWALVRLPLERFTKVVLVFKPESFLPVSELLQ